MNYLLLVSKKGSNKVHSLWGGIRMGMNISKHESIDIHV